MLQNDPSLPASVHEHANVFNALFLDNPHAAGETYLQHLAFTVKQGAYLVLTAAALIAHGLIPATCQTTASERLFRIHALFKSRWEKANAKNNH